MIELILKAFEQVAQSHSFWGSMGFTTAIAMFVGALLYDGHIDEAEKSSVSILAYASMIVWTNLIRINDTLSKVPNDVAKLSPNISNAYNSTATIVYITFFWFIGRFLGVLVFIARKKYNRMKVKN